ncbi:LysR family transcriptional regulator [Thalassovita sp.]|uniref:LysR family transcriptional regulator n=1 Tax=Thalassovita sp. TaxID=1979401 RepID=UPI002B26F39C|nr:LysR family transcriptional regulator [Thalassovita sp.]
MQVTLPNVRHLQAVREVAGCHRINEAAKRVHLSQPAVTQAVAKLERAVNEPLFDRRPEGMFTTEAGRLFLHRVNRALDLLKEGERQARRKASQPGRRDFHRLTTSTQLRALTAVAQTENFSHAARQLGVSQPAVHRAAKDLERLSGMTFFEPVRRGVQLTPSADSFAYYVRLAAAEMRQGEYEISALQGRDSTQIVVGSLPLSRPAILPAAMDRLLRSTEGGVQLHCIDAPYETLLRDLRFGEVDFILGALRDPLPADDVVQEPLFEDRLYVVAGKDHPLTKRSGLTLEDTLSFSWIAPPKSTPSGSYLFESLKIPQLPNTPVRIVASSLALVRGLMMRGDYLTIMSRRQLEVEMEIGMLVTLPIDLKGSARSIGLTCRAGWDPTPTQTRFMDMIRQEGLKWHR